MDTLYKIESYSDEAVNTIAEFIRSKGGRCCVMPVTPSSPITRFEKVKRGVYCRWSEKSRTVEVIGISPNLKSW